jgi:DNA-binding NarL/FixJ family response regulator
MSRRRVVLAEDYVLIQEAIRDLLEPEYEVVAAVEDGVAAYEAVATYCPELFLVDVSLPLRNGFAVAEDSLRLNPDLNVVFITAHAEPAYVARAFELGAKAYLLKSSLRLELLPAIRRVLSGGTYRSAMLRGLP